ncbi:MAG: hypothetical protein C0401_12690 [Anaerolinea sp.]|nr:hypothetical protein [Anaerolinea sp.]
MKFLKVIPVVVLILALMACSFTVNVPTVRTGVTQTLEIKEPVIADAQVNKISIEMGAGSLKLSGGATDLIEGTVRYNVAPWKPTITRQTDGITLTQKNTSNVGVPDGNITNEWNLKLGSSPIDLSLSAGAYEGDMDFSGLAITNLAISDGASKASLRFDSPNPVEMQHLSYKTGASNVELLGLGNANVHEITFDGGVGSYTLDFSGDMKNNVNVRVNSGMSDLTIIIPTTARALITITGGLSNINASGTWTISGSTYEYGSAGPMITINIDMAVGNLQLKQQ